MSAIAERVAKGAALLDEKGPTDWASEINLEALDIVSTSNCILGQLYGGYYTGQSNLEELDSDGYVIEVVSWEWGFSLVDWDAYYDGNTSERDLLWEAWQDEILDRTSD